MFMCAKIVLASCGPMTTPLIVERSREKHHTWWLIDGRRMVYGRIKLPAEHFVSHVTFFEHSTVVRERSKVFETTSRAREGSGVQFISLYIRNNPDLQAVSVERQFFKGPRYQTLVHLHYKKFLGPKPSQRPCVCVDGIYTTAGRLAPSKATGSASHVYCWEFTWWNYMKHVKCQQHVNIALVH
jgi:hypothetical protein